MKVRGFLAVLLLAMVIIYFVLFMKTGEKTNLQGQVERFGRAKAELTEVNMSQLSRVVVADMAVRGAPPASLKNLERTNPAAAAAFDGWGRAFRYERLSDESFRLVSAGPDGAFDTADDIVKEY
jgi:hypothetical protein